MAVRMSGRSAGVQSELKNGVRSKMATGKVPECGSVAFCDQQRFLQNRRIARGDVLRLTERAPVRRFGSRPEGFHRLTPRASPRRLATCERERPNVKIAVLLSGGVDSSVALKLVAEAGHRDINAFYLKIWLEDE